MKKILINSIILTLLIMFVFSCDNGDTNNYDDGSSSWSVVRNESDLAGVWEGSTLIELTGNDGVFTSAGSFNYKITMMNERFESTVDIIMKTDLSDYLDVLIADNPESGYTKDSLWTEVKNNLSGSGYNAGNYFILTSSYTFTSLLTETESLLINNTKDKLKIIMPKYDFALIGINIASDVVLILDKIAARPATLIIRGGSNIGGGEFIESVKILITTEDTPMEALGIAQYNEGFYNDGNDTVFSHVSTYFGRGNSRTFRIPGEVKYTVKVRIYRGSFLGWSNWKSESFTIANGSIATLTYDFLEESDGISRNGFRLNIANP